MADWILIFQVFVSPTVYTPPIVIQDFQNKALCEQAAETLASSMTLEKYNCLPIQKRNEHYE